MIFVTADSCRSHLERLTQLLVSAFPGSTIYQHTDPERVPHDVLSHPVDAVFPSYFFKDGCTIRICLCLIRRLSLFIAAHLLLQL